MRPKTKLLVIDDEPRLLSSLRRTLRAYDITGVGSSEEALVLLNSGQTFDGVLCDINMPRMTGGINAVEGPALMKPFTEDELAAALKQLGH